MLTCAACHKCGLLASVKFTRVAFARAISMRTTYKCTKQAPHKQAIKQYPHKHELRRFLESVLFYQHTVSAEHSDDTKPAVSLVRNATHQGKAGKE